MCEADLSPEVAQLANDIHAELLQEGGSVLSGESLRRALGYPSVGAMHKAIARKKLILPFFRMPTRRGLFVLSRDVAYFIARQRANAEGHCLGGFGEQGGGP